MAESDNAPSPLLEIKKYSNRRYYDATRSCHVTMEGIYDLIRSGHEVRITDSKSGENITSKVLAQIILEYDPLKLEAFPTAMLHEVIRSNEKIVREFVDKYFSQAFQSFLDSQRQFEEFLRQAMGLNIAGSAFPDMTKVMQNLPWSAFMTPGGAADSGGSTPERSPSSAMPSGVLPETPPVPPAPNNTQEDRANKISEGEANASMRDKLEFLRLEMERLQKAMDQQSSAEDS